MLQFDFCTFSMFFGVPPLSTAITASTISSKSGKPLRSSLEKMSVSFTVTSKEPEIWLMNINTNPTKLSVYNNSDFWICVVLKIPTL